MYGQKQKEWDKLKIKASPSTGVSQAGTPAAMKEMEMPLSKSRLATHIVRDVWAPGQGSFNVGCRSVYWWAVKPAAH